MARMQSSLPDLTLGASSWSPVKSFGLVLVPTATFVLSELRGTVVFSKENCQRLMNRKNRWNRNNLSMNKLMFFSLTGESVLWRHADIDACTSSESCGKTTSFAGMKKVREATPAG